MGLADATWECFRAVSTPTGGFSDVGVFGSGLQLMILCDGSDEIVSIPRSVAALC